jgi:hypothetical protein
MGVISFIYALGNTCGARASFSPTFSTTRGNAMDALEQKIFDEFLRLSKINNREEYLYAVRTLFMAFSGSWRGPDRKLINLVWYLLKLEPDDSQKIIRLKDVIDKKINIVRFARHYSDHSLGSFTATTQHVHWLRIFVCLWKFSGQETFSNESFYDR